MPDNNSVDGSLEFVQENFPWVNILPYDQNYGFAGGNNRAAKVAKGEYVAFLNPDTQVDENWLIELVNAMNCGDDTVIACGSKVMFFENNEIVQVAGSKMCPHGGGYVIGYGKKNNQDFNVLKYTMAPPGCAMLVKRDIFLQLGGFDPDYFMYIEESDFGYRLWLSGFKSLYVPTSVVYHKMWGDFKFKVSSMIIYNEEKNRLTTIVKNFEWTNVFKGLIISMCYAFYRGIYFLKNGKFELVKSLVKGQIDFLRELPKTLRKRKNIQRNRKLRDKDMYKLGLMASLAESYRELNRTKKYRQKEY
jgi:GT2 family glycosyltransferase